jgi:putative intracellular protease/amidase
MAKILLPLPDRDFDVTEVAVPWHLATRAGHEVVVATERGETPAADPLLLTGVIFGQLGADPEPKELYGRLAETPGFRRPVAFADVDPASFDAVLLPGGHAKGMRQYLEATVLQDVVRALVLANKPVGAICHGTIVLARTKDRTTDRSVLFGRKTTCLPKYMERSAYFLTAWKLGGYYRTYPAYVEDEVRAALASPTDFVRGPYTLSARGTEADDAPAFVVEDGTYVSARWPGDAYLFAKRFLAQLPSNASR